MIASFVPVAGVLLVIVPARIGLSFAGHPIRGIAEQLLSRENEQARRPSRIEHARRNTW
jgi:hypothetical protein